MKQITFIVILAASAIIISCNNNASSGHDHAGMDHSDSMPMHDGAAGDETMKTVSVTFTSVDPGVSAFMKSMMQEYLLVKNALINEKISEAAQVSGRMHEMMKGFDKSLLTAEQKTTYDKVAEDLLEQAEHISENNDIEHKRSHFSMMSSDMYSLVKAFGAGMPVYHDHCPMARDNQGAMWLSEHKDIRNPYFGDKMMTCGTVEEIIQ